MAIRFQCVGCTQPIEVDDPWAAQAVICPYCRRTVTAPAESTLGDPATIPVATPLAPLPAPASLPSPIADMVPPTNRIAVAAFVLAMLGVFMVVLSTLLTAPHEMELAEFQKELSRSGNQFAAYEQILKAHGGMPPWWLIAGGMMMLTAMGSCMASIVCALLGLRRAAHRVLVVVSLIVSGGFLLLVCSGVVGQFV